MKLPDVRQHIHEISRMQRFNAPSVVYLKMALPENRVLLLLGVSRNWGGIRPIWSENTIDNGLINDELHEP